MTAWRLGPDAGRSVAVVLCLVALWLATHPYVGVIHDARLYALQALHRLDPQHLASDLFVAYGSQDAFTSFSVLYGWFIARLGIAAAHALLTCLGALGWLLALLWFLRALFGHGRAVWLATASVLVLDSHYGANGIFSYAEAFVTPRLFAEALVLAALAALLDRRRWVAGFALSLAFLLHPLMALPGIGVALLWAVRSRRWFWLIIALGAVLGLILGWFGIEPFARAWMRFDADWLSVIQARSPFIFVSQWTFFGAFFYSLLPLIALAMGLRFATARQAHLMLVVTAVAGLGLLATLIGSDVAHNVLIVNLQPWRALWLLGLLGHAWAMVVALNLPANTQARQLFVIALAIGMLERWIGLPPMSSSLVAFLAMLVFLHERRTGRHYPLLLRLAVKTITVLALGLLIWHFIGLPALKTGYLALLIRLIIMTLGILLLISLLCRPRIKPLAAVALGSVLALISMAVTDQRTPWQVFIEAEQPPDDLRRLTDSAEDIYWENGVELMWFVLHRPSFVSWLQGAGIMFHRQTAMAYQRRAQALRPLNTVDFPIRGGGLCGGQGSAPDEIQATSRAQLADVCHRLPELDLMVLVDQVPEAQPRAWRSPVPMPVKLKNGRAWEPYEQFFFYDCATLR
jgi:hypothetical protein